MCMEHVDWGAYYEATSAGAPHRLFELLDPHLPSSGKAIDLGCGTGRGTLKLLAAGLEVVAVDQTEESLSYVRAKVPDSAPLTLLRSSFQDLELDSYEVAVGSFSLFFMPPADHAVFWKRLVDSIRPGGVWAGQFLGTRDEWRDEGYTTHTSEQVATLLNAFEIIHLEEEEKDGQTAVGTDKHWHVFHSIARKR